MLCPCLMSPCLVVPFLIPHQLLHRLLERHDGVAALAVAEAVVAVLCLAVKVPS